MELKDIYQKIGVIGMKVLMFLVSFAILTSILTGVFVVVTAMGFLQSFGVSAVLGMLFGTWCAMTLKKKDIEEEL